MYILLISALVCIFSSNIFGKGSITFKYFAVILLILGYFLLLILPFYVPKREREVKETKEILSAIEENLGELFEKFQKNSEI